MTREDIIRMAREQGFPETANSGVFIVNTDDLGRILAAQREACAQVCEGLSGRSYDFDMGRLHSAAAIREIGKK